MARAIRRGFSAAAVVLAAAGVFGGTAGTASADAPAQTSDVSAKQIDRWDHCSLAPSGSLVADFDTINDDAPDSSICWSGSGRAEGRHNGELRQVHTANNKGSLQLKTGGNVWDKPFDRNQTHDFPKGTVLVGLSLNE